MTIMRARLSMGSGFQKPGFEMSVGEILRSSISLYRARPLGPIAIFFVSSLLSQLLLMLVGGRANPLGMLATIIPSVALQAFAGSVVVRYASEELEGRVATLKDAFYSVLPRLLQLVMAGIAIGVLFIIGALLFIVPGILIAIVFYLTGAVIIIEQVGAIDAMKRSRSLAEGRWMKIFALILLLAIVSIFVTLPGWAVVAVEVLVLKVDVATAQASLPFVMFSFLSSVLTGPLNAISSTYLYYSMKVKGIAKSEGPLPPPPS